MKTKPCSKCPNPAKPNQRYCKKCHAEYMREWRKLQKEANRIYSETVSKFIKGDKINLTAEDILKVRTAYGKKQVPNKPRELSLKHLNKEDREAVLSVLG